VALARYHNDGLGKTPRFAPQREFGVADIAVIRPSLKHVRAFADIQHFISSAQHDVRTWLHYLGESEIAAPPTQVN
jgi:hypothetical protein